MTPVKVRMEGDFKVPLVLQVTNSEFQQLISRGTGAFQFGPDNILTKKQRNIWVESQETEVPVSALLMPRCVTLS